MEAAKPEGRQLFRNRLFLILIALAILAGGLLYSLGNESGYRKEVERTLASIVDLKVGELVQWRKERMGDGIACLGNAYLASLTAALIEDPADTATRGLLVSWLVQTRAAFDYDAAFILYGGGGLLASEPVSASPGTAIAAAAPGILAENRVDFLDFYRDSRDGRVYLCVMAPIGSGANGGVLALRIDPERYLYPFINRWPTPSSSGETLLVRREAEEVVYLNSLRFRPDAALALRFPIAGGVALPAAHAVLGLSGAYEGRDYRGRAVLSHIRSVPGSPWFLVAKMDIAEVEEGVLGRQALVLALILCLLGMEAASVFALTRRQQAIYFKHRAEIAAALRESEERLRLALAAGKLGLYDLDIRSGEIHVNETYAAMLGYDPATFRESNAAWLERLHPEDREAAGRAYLDYIQGKTPEYRLEFRQRKAEGGWKWILSFGKIVERDASGAPLRMLGTHADITERKEAELRVAELNAELERRVAERTAQLEDSNQELESFAYSVAHDLRAPLRSIDGFSRIIQEDYAGVLDPEGLRLFGIVRGSAQRMDRLISELLEISRIGRTELRLARLDMKAMAGEAFSSIADPEAASDFDLRIGNLPEAFADTDLMGRVWSNLLSNAIKYSRPSPTRSIVIEGREEGGMNVYSVKDRGVGFDPLYAEKLFGMFQRLHGAKEFEGTGVGLAIVKRVVLRHGGKVWAEGRIGEGATFFFSLPARSLA